VRSLDPDIARIEREGIAAFDAVPLEGLQEELRHRCIAVVRIEYIDVLGLKPNVPGIAVVSHSGGISSLTADMCGQAGLDLPPLGEEARDGINGILKGFGWAANPADVTGFANSESFPQIIEHMTNDPRMGTLVVASAGADTQAQQVISQRDRTDKGVVFLWTGSRDAKAGLAQLKHARIPIFYTPDKLARGLQSRLAACRT